MMTREEMIDEAVRRATNVHDRRDLFLRGGDNDFVETYAIHRIVNEVRSEFRRVVTRQTGISQ
jgi:hypothetical protein